MNYLKEAGEKYELDCYDVLLPFEIRHEIKQLPYVCITYQVFNEENSIGNIQKLFHNQSLMNTYIKNVSEGNPSNDN